MNKTRRRGTGVSKGNSKARKKSAVEVSPRTYMCPNCGPVIGKDSDCPYCGIKLEVSLEEALRSNMSREKTTVKRNFKFRP